MPLQDEPSPPARSWLGEEGSACWQACWERKALLVGKPLAKALLVGRPLAASRQLVGSWRSESKASAEESEGT